ncbi:MULTISPECIES: MOSC domain-containing protein [unclassified Ruegeria]|uniref:MOSC domain-containing protein n=1 Tax=unclassified Ruegeria TaxID=2625375 RepID=UPI001489603D|nr:MULTISPECIES: MOSC domain-containing protein [unclassified Ruegeria]NOD35048.1 MOSC domain-containing protein [Ruegeria sp. HKCCD7296]NOD47872.1 MOSC domain-containing protein [Ruegeria sp. HKCCD5849]NOD52856.1 MOSC domain-containing protein [Ruegeria sp. HKCCD5851]NOD69002.1 MOSC domain-containing protein [Ruegeria sp. HKCCD7303]NOE35301.1 MOSC domain-containing protein [Ruegeria sp. HKCCD7318]
MSELAKLIAGWAQPGRVEWIGLRPERRVEMVKVNEAVISIGGLDGDRGRAGTRAVTLIQHEHLAAIGTYLGQRPVAPEILRRNLVVSGINLAALKGREVQVGEAILRFTVICAPCSRMEEALGQGGYSAVRGHGGWCAEVLRPGRVKLGDAVQPVD